MVEINTLFQQLTSLLDKVAPDQLNETLTALGSALSGRGHQIGKTIDQFDAFLATVEPALPALSRELAAAPTVFNTYADAAPDLVTTVDNSARISQTVVDEQHNLDAFLLSAIGLAQAGTPLLSENRQPLADVLHLLVPTTDLTNEYNPALNCQITGMAYIAKWPPLRVPGAEVIAGLTAGQERYRYPGDLPKVGAKGGPHCEDLPVPFRPDRATRMMRFGPTAVKFGVFAAVMVLLTAGMFLIFDQYQTGAKTGYSAIFADASSLRAGASVRMAGIRIGTVHGVSLRDDTRVEVDFDADRDVVGQLACSPPALRFPLSAPQAHWILTSCWEVSNRSSKVSIPKTSTH
jgi:ABC-type transporter Mla subunit MlaD